MKRIAAAALTAVFLGLGLSPAHADDRTPGIVTRHEYQTAQDELGAYKLHVQRDVFGAHGWGQVEWWQGPNGRYHAAREYHAAWDPTVVVVAIYVEQTYNGRLVLQSLQMGDR